MAPVPVRARVGVHAGDVRAGRPGHVVVAEDVLPVQRDVVLLRQVPHQPRRRAVHRLGVPGARVGQEALVLDADRLGVGVPVARVPADVLRLDVLRDVPVRGADGVVPGQVRRVLHELQRGVPGALGVVDDDRVDLLVRRAVGLVVVAVVPAAEVLVRRRHPLAAQVRRALGARVVGRRAGPPSRSARPPALSDGTAASATRWPLSVVRACPCSITAKTSSAKESAVARSSAPE